MFVWLAQVRLLRFGPQFAIQQLISLLFIRAVLFEWVTDGGLKRLRWGCQSSSGEDLKQLR